MPPPIMQSPGLPTTLAELEDPFLRKRLPHESRDPMVFSMMLLGVATSMTWSVLVMAVDDLQRLVPGMDGEYQLAAAYKACNFAVGAATLAVGWRQRLGLRVALALGTQALSLIGLELLCEMGGSRRHCMQFLFLVTVLGGAGQALAHSTLAGLCGMCPERYMRAFVVGIGGSAIVAGLVKLAAKGVFAGVISTERLWLFSMVALYLMAIVCYFKVIHGNVNIRVSLDLAEEEEAATQTLTGRPKSGGRLWHVLKQMYVWSMLMVLNWAVTYSVFPGMTADLDSASVTFQKSGWYHLLLMFTFVCFDVVGRQITSIRMLRGISLEGLCIITLARTFFVPLFLAINYVDGSHRVTDVAAFIAMALLATSNGFCVSICCTAPLMRVDPSDRQLAGYVGFLSYATGQLAGVMVALSMKLSGVVPAF